MADADRSGRSQLGGNVMWSWASQFVFILFGFLMPRAIHEAVGQTALGVWDFAWSIVHYLAMSMIGIGSAVNRYVARYRARHDDTALSRTISSVAAVQLGIATGVWITAILLSLYIPRAMQESLGELAQTAGWLVLLLGSSIAVQMAFDVFRGILTGCHRWRMYNGLNAGGYAVAATGMLSVLLMGYGLREMAIVYLVVTVATELLRAFVAIRACPEIQFSVANVNRHDAVKVVKFGVKTIVGALPKMITLQTVSIFVAAKMGPAMLAILARPMALMFQIMVMMEKFSNVLVPTAGSLQGSNQIDELREFAINSLRVGWFLTILPLTFMLVLGDRVIHIWMGAEYVDFAIMAIAAGGMMLPASQNALLKIMIGMNEHGKIAKQSFINAIVALVIGLVVLQFFEWTLVNAAILISLPSIFGAGMVIPYYGCRRLNLSFREYSQRVLRDPIALLAVVLPGLILVRLYGPAAPPQSLLLGMVVQGVLAIVVLRKDLVVLYNMIFRKRLA